MDRDPLNFFQPFERLPPNHENQLTRALLLVLRFVPIAHEYWLTRTGEKRRLAQLPEAQFTTQRRYLPLTVEDTDEPIDLVSVFLEPRVTPGVGAIVTESDRRQVLDAIIEYPGELVVVVENKVVTADDKQATQINLTGANVRSPGSVVHLEWPELLADFDGILERQLVAGAEYRVLSDFLAYVENQFPDLGPYRTLRLCERNPFRVGRRLRTVLMEDTQVEAKMYTAEVPCADLPGVGGVGKWACLEADKELTMITLSAYPADTLTQARIFYARPEALQMVRDLATHDGWRVRPNFHFGHMEAGYAWTQGDISLPDYIELWTRKVLDTAQVPRGQWPEYFKWLIDQKIAIEKDREEFDRHFTTTSRATATPRPGLAVSRRWSFDEAEQLDANGKFSSEVAEAYQVLIALAKA